MRQIVAASRIDLLWHRRCSSYPVLKLRSTAQGAETPLRGCRSASHCLPTSVALVLLLGCAGEGPAIQAEFQQITFDPLPTIAADQTSVVVSAHASSGLAVIYSSRTRDICSVDSNSGLVAGKTSGTCVIVANQPGNTEFGPAFPVTQNLTFQLDDTLTFVTTLSLSLYDTTTVQAIDASGSPVHYATTTPAVCSIDSTTGLVTALSTGTCTVVASAGTLESVQSATIEPPASVVTAPGVPSGVTATLGGTAATVTVSVETTASGGSPITSYFLTSIPPGIATTSPTLPILVACPANCAGYAFSVVATNAYGASPGSPPVDVVTNFKITTTFYEPDTQPNNSIFVGHYTLDSTTGIVSNLHGKLSESMTGGDEPYPNDTMNWLTLDYQLSTLMASVGGADGTLVTTFLLNTTNTFSNNPAYGGTDGWTPGTGKGWYYGHPGTNPGNAYARVFINLKDPLAELTQAEIDKLAYADCAPGGMMGATCMTGTSVAGYGTTGTMSGYPISQNTEQE